MGRLVSISGVAGVAVLIAACGGGGGSSPQGSTGARASGLTKAQEGSKPDAGQIARNERQVERQNKEFREKEEERIRHEEAERGTAAKQRQAHRKARPKPQQTASASAESAINPIAAEEFHNFKGTDRSNWEIAFGICAVTPEKQLASEFHTEQNWAAIGHAYGSGYREPFNIAAEEGCMAALKDDHAQREAAFALMEENE